MKSRRLPPLRARLYTWVLSALAALVLPLGYFAVSTSNLKVILETEAEINGRLLSGIISANPDLWRFETVRIQELLDRRPHSSTPEIRRAWDERNTLVASSGNPLPAPRIRAVQPITDTGLVVGRIEISRSLVPILLQSGLLALVGLGVGLLVRRSLPFRDLAEAMEQLREANDFLHKVMEACTNPIVVLDPRGRIQMSNGAFRKLTLRAAEADLCFPELFQGEARVRVEAGLAQARSLPPQATAFEGILRDGEEREIHLAGEAASLHPGAATSGLVVSLMDLTERKRAEAEKLALEQRFQQNQKLQSLGSLAGGIAHDMNNVLGAILGLSTAHVEAQAEGSPVRAAFETIIKASERGGAMVKSLLRFARQSPMEKLDLDLNGLLREAVRLVEGAFPQGLRLVTSLDPALRPMRGDATALTHAFVNLLVNALDAMPLGGTLSLSTREEGDDWLRVSVEDTGQGMGPEVLAKAMDPFFTTKEVGKGTGLGLSLVHSTVKAHQGHIQLHSEPGRGTRVDLRFPASLVSDAPSALEPEPAARAVHRPLRVLVVDDDEFFQLSCRMILEKLGHTACSAFTGAEGLRKVEEGLHPDVAILDMNMPVLGGADTLPRLRVLEPSLPIILATGRADQTALDLAESYAHVTLLPKPFSMTDLQRRLDPFT